MLVFQLGGFTGEAQFGATFDLEKLITLPNTKLQVTYTSRFGRNLVDDSGLDTLQLVQEVWGRGQAVRLTLGRSARAHTFRSPSPPARRRSTRV